MTIIKSKRIKGNGIGYSMKFPTINLILDELPNDISTGLYVVYTDIFYSYGMCLISISNKKFRLEIHLDECVTLDVGEEIEIKFFNKLRDEATFYKQVEMIEHDKKIYDDFFLTCRTCDTCRLLYYQDEGYSNWTVTGTSIGCFAEVFTEKNDSGMFSRKPIPELLNGITCEYYTKGSPKEVQRFLMLMVKIMKSDTQMGKLGK